MAADDKIIEYQELPDKIDYKPYGELTETAAASDDAPFDVSSPRYEDVLSWKKRGEMRNDPYINEVVAVYQRAFRKWGKFEIPEGTNQGRIETYLNKILPPPKLRNIIQHLSSMPWDGYSLIALNFYLDSDGDLNFTYQAIPPEWLDEIKKDTFNNIELFELNGGEYTEESRRIPRKNSLYVIHQEALTKSKYGLPLFLVFYKPWFVQQVNQYALLNEIQYNPNVMVAHLKDGNKVAGSGGDTRGGAMLKQMNRAAANLKLVVDSEDKVDYIGPSSTLYGEYSNLLDRMAVQIRVGAHIPFTNTGGEGGGSYALSKEQRELVDEHLTATLLRPIEEELNRFLEYLITHQFGVTKEEFPSWNFTELKSKDMERRAETVSKLVQGGVLSSRLTANKDAEKVLEYLDPELASAITFEESEEEEVDGEPTVIPGVGEVIDDEEAVADGGITNNDEQIGIGGENKTGEEQADIGIAASKESNGQAERSEIGNIAAHDFSGAVGSAEINSSLLAESSQAEGTEVSDIVSIPPKTTTISDTSLKATKSLSGTDISSVAGPTQSDSGGLVSFRSSPPSLTFKEDLPAVPELVIQKKQSDNDIDKHLKKNEQRVQGIIQKFYDKLEDAVIEEVQKLIRRKGKVRANLFQKVAAKFSGDFAKSDGSVRITLNLADLDELSLDDIELTDGLVEETFGEVGKNNNLKKVNSSGILAKDTDFVIRGLKESGLELDPNFTVEPMIKNFSDLSPTIERFISGAQGTNETQVNSRKAAVDAAKRAVKEGIQSGLQNNVIYDNIRKGVENKLTPSRAATIARTLTTDIFANTKLEVGRSAELGDFVKGFMYNAILDDRTTPICEELHGTIFAKDDPALSALTPPLHHNCRSWLEIVSRNDTDVEPDFVADELENQPSEGFGEVRPFVPEEEAGGGES